MLSRISALLSVVLAFGLVGCANTRTMPFADNPGGAPPSGAAIYLMTVTTKNIYHTSYQPDLIWVMVNKAGAQGSSDAIDFKMDDLGSDETGTAGAGNSYLARVQLDPGEYEILGLRCLNRQFPIIADFFVPLQEKLVVTASGVYYLGHVDAVVRERVGDEFKAGPTIPLIDQAAGGASGGTFDVVISDHWPDDETQFESKFSGLKGVSVQKAIMAPFDRQLAQKWWESNANP